MIRLFLLMCSFLFAKEVVITKYINEKPLIYISFQGSKESLRVLRKDLEVVSHFDYSINKDNGAYYKFSFSMGKNRLRVKYLEDGKLKEIREYAVRDENMYPFLIHKAVNDINSYFKLPSTEFLTKKVVFSILEEPKKANIYIADYTFTYKKRIIKGGLNIFPKWANKKQTAIFYSHLGKKAYLHRVDLKNNTSKILLSSPGLLIVSDVKGKDLLISKDSKELCDVFKFNTDSKILKQLTFFPGIDLNGKFWNNDIVFISDRYGVPYAFTKNLITKRVKRVMYHGKNQIGIDVYKNLLVVSTRESDKSFGPNTFNLFLIDKNSASLRRLTYSGQNSFPNFSVDGSSIMFVKRKGFKSFIGIIRLYENKIFYFPLPKMIQSFDW